MKVFEPIHRCPTEDGRYDLIWFRCEPDPEGESQAELKLDPNEVSEAGWFSPQEALQLAPMFDATRRYFRSLLEETSP